MKIAFIIAGSGNTFYCENCVRDRGLVEAIHQAGHTVTIIPMYLPLPDMGVPADRPAPLFYGAVGLYLKNMFPCLNRLPRWIDKLLDSPLALYIAARQAGSTRARGLDDLTVSMLAGRQGNQVRALESLVGWIKNTLQPDIVHLSNALLLGLAPSLARELNVPLLCSLQDENIWLDEMQPAAAARAWELMAGHAQYICRFTAVSRYYAAFMQERLGLPGGQMVTVYNGVDMSLYQCTQMPFQPPVIGFLARNCREMGLDILVDAFIRLTARPGMGAVRLHIAGGHTPDDHAFLRSLKSKLRSAGRAAQVSFIKGFSPAERAAFLKTITLLSVPTLHSTALGLYQLEALAAGVPVVQPHVGAFPELIASTGGGVTYEPGTAAGLEQACYALLSEPAKIRELGRRGREAMSRMYTSELAAARMLEVYNQCLGRMPRAASGG